MRIAVIGSGISGLSAAQKLSKKHHVDLFESEDHFGGHSYTLDTLINGKKVLPWRFSSSSISAISKKVGNKSIADTI